MKKVFLTSLMVIFLLGVSFSQITQTGTLNGRVTDTEGNPLPGVSVTIKSPALILPQMTATTNAEGYFRFPALPPGVYTVTFEMSGFKTLVREGIRVNVGVTTTLDVSLELSPIQESIVVTGQSPVVDRQRTTLVRNLTTEFLQNIPATRTLGTFFNMVPGVTGDTAHGSSVRDNVYALDGVNITDPVTGTQAGSFSIDIMEELSVQTAGLPAEYGSVRGAMINVVTKSGGNQFKGSFSTYYRDDEIKALKLKMQADNTKGTIFEGQPRGGFDYEIEPVLTLGGPIIKDKIWFFTNLSLLTFQEYVRGYPYDKQPQNSPVDRFDVYPYIKFTYQATPNDRIVLSYNFFDLRRHHRGASAYMTEDTTWKQTTPIHTGNFQWTKLFGPNFFMNFKVAFLDYELNLMAKNAQPRYIDQLTSRLSGSYGYDDIYTRNRAQALTDATWFVDNLMGRHEFKAGLEGEFSWDSRRWRSNYDPKTGLGPFFYMRGTTPDYVIYYDSFKREDQKLYIGGFLQDTWNPTERLTLNLGFRLEHQEGIIPKQGENRSPITILGVVCDPRVTETFKPMVWNTLSPRIGLNYDIFGNGKTVFKASFGRYYIANILQWFVTVNPNSFITYRYRLNPDFTPKGSLYQASSTANDRMDPDVKSPYLDELTVGFEREIVRDLSFGVRYIKKWDRNLMEGVDLTALDFDKLMSGADIFTVWTNYEPVTVVDPFDGKTVTFWKMKNTAVLARNYYTNPPGAERDYDGVEVTLNKRFSNRWMMMASYVYAHSRGLIGTDFNDSWTGTGYFNNPNAHINAYGEFPLERRHQFKLQGLWQGPWGINISGYYRYLDGARWTRQIRSYDLGLSLPQGVVTIYAEKRGSRKLPPLKILDLRVEKSFNILGGRKLGLFLDVFNVLNANTATGVWAESSRSTKVAGKTVYFGQHTSIMDPRIARIGFRFDF